MPAGRSRKTGSGSSRHKVQKQAAKRKFDARHIDQVFNDFSQQPGEVHDGRTGPIGTDSKCVPLAQCQHLRLAMNALRSTAVQSCTTMAHLHCKGHACRNVAVAPSQVSIAVPVHMPVLACLDDIELSGSKRFARRPVPIACYCSAAHSTSYCQ